LELLKSSKIEYTRKSLKHDFRGFGHRTKMRPFNNRKNQMTA